MEGPGMESREGTRKRDKKGGRRRVSKGVSKEKGPGRWPRAYRSLWPPTATFRARVHSLHSFYSTCCRSLVFYSPDFCISRICSVLSCSDFLDSYVLISDRFSWARVCSVCSFCLRVVIDPCVMLLLALLRCLFVRWGGAAHRLFHGMPASTCDPKPVWVHRMVSYSCMFAHGGTLPEGSMPKQHLTRTTPHQNGTSPERHLAGGQWARLR